MQQCIFPCPRKSTLLSALKTLKTIYRRMLGYRRNRSYIYVVRLPEWHD